MIFAINLTVDTKTTDLYDQVAVNKYPIIVICNDEKELWEKLSSSSTISWVRKNVRTNKLFDSAYFYIRGINGADVTEFTWKANSLIKYI